MPKRYDADADSLGHEEEVHAEGHADGGGNVPGAGEGGCRREKTGGGVKGGGGTRWINIGNGGTLRIGGDADGGGVGRLLVEGDELEFGDAKGNGDGHVLGGIGRNGNAIGGGVRVEEVVAREGGTGGGGDGGWGFVGRGGSVGYNGEGVGAREETKVGEGAEVVIGLVLCFLEGFVACGIKDGEGDAGDLGSGGSEGTSGER